MKKSLISIIRSLLTIPSLRLQRMGDPFTYKTLLRTFLFVWKSLTFQSFALCLLYLASAYAEKGTHLHSVTGFFICVKKSIISIIRSLLITLSLRLPRKGDPFTYKTLLRTFLFVWKSLWFQSFVRYLLYLASAYQVKETYLHIKLCYGLFYLCEKVYHFNHSPSTYYS